METMLLLVGALSASTGTKLMPVASELLSRVFVRQLPLKRHVGHRLVHIPMGRFSNSLLAVCGMHDLFVAPIMLCRIRGVPQNLIHFLL